ncbi:uncharacterized protein BDV17DRAFT_250403 [Aspergillus undulatus]|uniref:uncharacterized protein n=1 Tax=Aspergillus undulatus TaxID=1810928 RepID=UPI003CCDFBC6
MLTRPFAPNYAVNNIIMPSYIVSLKKSATDEEVQAVKDNAVSNGGTITHEYKLIKAFAVSVPEVSTLSFEGHPHVERVEEDQEVKTQPV